MEIPVLTSRFFWTELLPMQTATDAFYFVEAYFFPMRITFPGLMKGLKPNKVNLFWIRDKRERCNLAERTKWTAGEWAERLFPSRKGWDLGRDPLSRWVQVHSDLGCLWWRRRWGWGRIKIGTGGKRSSRKRHLPLLHYISWILFLHIFSRRLEYKTLLERISAHLFSIHFDEFGD